MNEIVKEAYNRMDEDYKRYIPELEVGDIVEMNDLWDGSGDYPEKDFSIQVSDLDWINYSFEIIEEKEHELDTLIKITAITLL